MTLQIVRRSAFLWLVACVAVFAACTTPDAGDQDKNWTSAERLVDTSDRVVVGRFVDSRIETIQSDDSGAAAEGSDVLFREFELTETLKGTTDEGDLLWVSFNPGEAGELVDGSGSAQEFRQESTYVLFLKGRLRPLEYPVDYGPVLWTGNGEPAFAELSGDDLMFRSSRVYLDLLTEQGLSLPEPLSAAPFELTLTGLRAMTK